MRQLFIWYIFILKLLFYLFFIFLKGNLTFIDVDGEHCSIKQSTDENNHLEWISKLLDCEQSDISLTLTSRVLATLNESFQARQNITRAYYGRDTLSKVCHVYLKKREKRIFQLGFYLFIR